MILCESILICLMVVVGCYVTITDFRQGIIENKILFPAVLIGIIIDIIYYIGFVPDFFIYYLLNLFFVSIAAILLYVLHFWAAGDSKLLICVMLLFPGRFLDVGDTTYIVSLEAIILIFLLAYIYIIADTVYQWIRKKRFYQKKILSKEFFLNFIKRYIISFLYLRGLSEFLKALLGNIYLKNQIAFTFLNIFIALVIHRNTIFKKWYCLVLVLLINLRYFNNGIIYSIEYKSYLLLLVVFIIRYFLNGYNYKEIPTEQIKKGMILSIPTVSKFRFSRVRGLPKISREDMSTRVTQEEAEAIQRWKKSKYGEKTIVIVRKMPFAVFIVLGTIIFFFIRVLR